MFLRQICQRKNLPNPKTQNKVQSNAIGTLVKRSTIPKFLPQSLISNRSFTTSLHKPVFPVKDEKDVLFPSSPNAITYEDKQEKAAYIPESDEFDERPKMKRIDIFSPQVSNEAPIVKTFITPPSSAYITSKIDKNGCTFAVGRRKKASASIVIKPGSGTVTVNNRALVDYFPWPYLREMAILPLSLTENYNQFDIRIWASGGGISGQAGAIMHGLSRALYKRDPEMRMVLKKAGCLTRDPRMVESKKAGRKKARKKFQWSKR